MAFVYTWNSAFEAQPANAEARNLGAQRIREVKAAVKERVAQEHYFAGNAHDGRTLAGSGRPYYQADAPTKHPDGVTDLANDVYSRGRLWVDSDDVHRSLNFYDAANGWRVMGMVPVGTIVAWCQGTFGAGADNTGFVESASLKVASLPANWKVCDGSVVSNALSVLNGGYLPNLTDTRFIAGGTADPASAATMKGGAGTATLAETNVPAHTHAVPSLSVAVGADGEHRHVVGRAGTATSGVSSNITHIGSLWSGTDTVYVDAASHVMSFLWSSTEYAFVAETSLAGVSSAHSHAGATGTGTTGTGSGSATAFAIVPTYLRTTYIMRIY